MFQSIKKIFGKKPCLGVIGPDVYDSRDFLYEPKHKQLTMAGKSLSKEFSLQDLSCPILDQGKTNSCTGHAAAAACNILTSKILNEKKNYKINPYYIYYYARFIDGTQLYDNGAYMRSLMKALKEYGFCSCNMYFPSDTPPEDFKNSTFKIKDYKRINNSVEDVQYALQIDMLPVLISFSVCYKAINDWNGIIKYDGSNTFDGFHAVTLLGWKYIDDMLYFIVQNSWSSSYGDNGLYYLDARYITDFMRVRDIWTFDSDYAF